MRQTIPQLAAFVSLLFVVGCDQSRLNVDILEPVDGGTLVDGADPFDGGGSFDKAGGDSPGERTSPCSGDGCVAMDGPGFICSNGVIEEGESCDDGNARPGDGCSGVCRLEANFECPMPGLPCRSTIVCGDGLVMGEACDDGNTSPGDGCSMSCEVEAGYACAHPGQPCTPASGGRCGDGVVNHSESCDDGGLISGDGCSQSCQLELGWTCPVPDQACVRDEYCGDSRLNGTEDCDDGNIAPGDGCSGLCLREPFFDCKVPGMPCTTTIICGDFKVVGDEACDDGNRTAGDGCAADCKQVEAGYSCPTAVGVGGACVAAPLDRCGDGRLTYGEYCDDGNGTAGDGCSDVCRVEAGHTCPAPGQACRLVEWCGNGLLSIGDGEQCDDGNDDGGDGCSARCVVETHYICPQPGEPCESTVKCGDRKVTGGETCDDGNLINGDGCSLACAVETGWTCPVGASCRPTRCGDGLKVGTEQCDDGNVIGGDGCSAQCQLQLPTATEANGWQCAVPGQPCARTLCGNGIKEGSEQCDDGNNDMGDLCTPFCRKEPVCPAAGGACSTSCGDGLLLAVDMAAGQECDDGNTVSGDGCSADCKIEIGYACQTAPVQQDPLILPIIYRDFKAFHENGGHPDFQQYLGSESGIVQSTLGTNGKPVHASTNKMTTANHNPGVITDYFGVWYKDDPAYNLTLPEYLVFTKQGNGYYYDNASFFPLDGEGWGTYGGHGHNFHFTSEVRYWFEYTGNEQLDFTGDDDVWVFINKKLTVDLGGVHGALNGNVTLHASNGTGAVCDLLNSCGGRRTVSLGMVPGNVYEIVVFQAERRTTQSKYRLTLSNFSGSRSTCGTVCGDGVAAGAETCDLGTAQNTGAYGTCNADCTLPPRCGDGIKQEAEACDDGINASTYGALAEVCAPGCVIAPRCGDGRIDSANGEACDDGATNGGGYGHCSQTCQLGPRCGDAVVSDGEECDDGTNNGNSSSVCSAICKRKCGNGLMDPLEQCDMGAANNTGGYGMCKSDCSWDARCGDGVKNGAETCDDGKNDGSYGTCAPMCLFGPRCGDGMVQASAGETCDRGEDNVTSAYGMDKCTTRCRPAPRCGDRAVDVAHGELCDDGVNSGLPGSCTGDCSGYVPLDTCGNGALETPEVCDDGMANGTAASTCDTRCRYKCGNGFRDTGELCDDGVNDGSYGTCKAGCMLAAYCGDGIKNGPEGCDLGADNDGNAYGPGKCTNGCFVAPYCGDGRIQTAHGETCDSTPGCSSQCRGITE